MKKQLFGLMTILTILSACQKNEVSVSLPEEVTIHATIEEKDATKTIMDESNNILWSENDQIIAFMKSSYGYKYQVKPSFVGKSYADFSMVSSDNGSDLSVGNEWDHNVVYYPYSENIECLKSGTNYALEVNLPSEQVYVPDSFANGSMAMIAVSENNHIKFMNVLGGIKIQLKGTQIVRSIRIEGNNNEKLSGPAVVTAYTDGTKPVITMASDAVEMVTLDCGSGVQLNENAATEFILTLPPGIFSLGFIVTVTDTSGKTYTLSTDKSNTVLRSSILVMPSSKLGVSTGGDADEGEDIIPISKITLNQTSLSLPLNYSYLLTAKIAPVDATNQSVIWSSDDPSVVRVNQNGEFETLKAGEANVFAEADGCYGFCKISVIPQRVDMIDYVDEYGVNHGKGVALGNVVWAPVNCGYKAATANAKGFPYGKLYQWGRKYGQGYSLDYDESEPEIVEGPISCANGQKEKYSNTFFTNTDGDWMAPSDDLIWNSGTEQDPVKTEYDPCPEGWRVPTYTELKLLSKNKYKLSSEEGWYSGEYSYLDNISKVYLPPCGTRDNYEGNVYERNGSGRYWSSTIYTSGYISGAHSDGGAYINLGERANGHGVRCVQE